MTREERITNLKILESRIIIFDEDDNKQVTALREIIQELEQQPCEDTISRQYLLDNCIVDKVTMPYVPVSKIENAPPVAPQPKIGRWIYKEDTLEYKCSECSRVIDTHRFENPYIKYPYCHCGAKMVEWCKDD